MITAETDNTPVPIDRIELLVVLGRIYAKTSVCYEKVSLSGIIKTSNAPSVDKKRNAVLGALVETGLLFRKGGSSQNYTYMWNHKFGPPSLPMCDWLIEQIYIVKKRRQNEQYARRTQRKKNRIIG